MNAHSLIIGGTRGVGRELVRVFREQRHTVSVIGKRPPPAEDKGQDHVHYWATDVSHPESLASTLREILQRNGRVNHLVFLQRFRGSGDPWPGELETALGATRNAIEALRDQFAHDGDRAIVVVSSIADELVADGQPVSYHVAKAGLYHLARYYAVALGPKGIRVNCVSPSTFQKRENAEFYQDNPELVKLFERTIPLGRMGNALDVAHVIDFLCGPKAAFVTGQRIAVDGGVSLLAQESLARKIAGL